LGKAIPPGKNQEQSIFPFPISAFQLFRFQLFLSPEDARLEIQRIYELIRTKIATEVTIRRTRTDLRDHDDYRKDLDARGITFPESFCTPV